MDVGGIVERGMGSTGVRSLRSYAHDCAFSLRVVRMLRGAPRVDSQLQAETFFVEIASADKLPSALVDPVRSRILDMFQHVLLLILGCGRASYVRTVYPLVLGSEDRVLIGCEELLRLSFLHCFGFQIKY